MFKKTKIEIVLKEPTIINQNTLIKGEIFSKSDIKLDGFLKGKMISEKKIIIGKNGEFVGELKCEDLIIEGSVEGKALVSNITSLFTKSKFNGVLSTQKFKVEEGASFDGDCQTITPNKSPESIKIIPDLEGEGEILETKVETQTKDLALQKETQTEIIEETLDN